MKRIYVTRGDVELARAVVMAAELNGTRPDPRMVKIAEAKPAPPPSEAPTPAHEVA